MLLIAGSSVSLAEESPGSVVIWAKSKRFLQLGNRGVELARIHFRFAQTEMGFRVSGIQLQRILKSRDGFFSFTATIERKTTKIADQKIRPQLLLRDGKLVRRFLGAARSQKYLRQSNVARRKRIAGGRQVAKDSFRFEVMSCGELRRSHSQMQ